MLARVLVVVVVGVGVPLAVSQLLPPNTSAPRSSAIPLLLLVALGGLAGWVAPTVRAWIVTALWVVTAAALVLAAWTDLLLNVSPSIAPVDAWRGEAFVAILGAVAVVSVGFAFAAVVRRRGALGPRRRSTGLVVGAVAIACVVGAGLTAAACSRTGIVLQEDAPRLTVVVTDAGIEVTPSVIDGIEYEVVYESRSGRPRLLASVTPLGVADGMPRAVTTSEVMAWVGGDWAALGPQFQSAVSWRPIAPGERQYGGRLQLTPSPDGTGGALWYSAALDALRPWPPGPGDDVPEPAPWPVDHHVVVPTGGR